MRIGIDLRFTASSCMGTGTYAETMALALADAQCDGDELIGFTEGDLGDTPLGRAVSQRPISQRIAGSQPAAAQRLILDAAIERERLDVLFAPAGIGPRFPSCPVVLTIHDLLFERHPEFFGAPLLRYLRSEIPRSVRAAARVLAVSRATAAEVGHHYGVGPDLVQVFQQPLRALTAATPTPNDIKEARAAAGVDSPYLLTLTNHAPHKNTALLLEAFALWSRASSDRTYRLVIAGGGLAPQAPVDLRALAARLGIADRIVITGRITDRHLPGLLAGAALYLHPSLHEGWGLPPLEAMAMGTPVIVSDRGGLPEAIGDAGIVLPADDPRAWSQAILAVISHGTTPARREAMAARVRALREPRGAALRTCLAEVAALGRAQRALSPVRSGSSAHALAAHRLSGCMIIRNGLRLGYPFIEAIHAVIAQVDEMVVVDGRSDDGTWDILKCMASTCPRLRISQEPWPATTSGGTAIAMATNQALRRCTGTHILYVQADEIHTPANLKRLHELLRAGHDYAAMPFLHFRNSWWSVLENPAYAATIRCVPNHAEVESVGDGTTFRGPPGRGAAPEAFPDPIFHVGWVYAPNILAKHRNHAELYADHADYQDKARLAARLSDDASAVDLGKIDGEYRVRDFTGAHPAVISHLIKCERYEHLPGLERWTADWPEAIAGKSRVEARSPDESNRGTGARVAPGGWTPSLEEGLLAREANRGWPALPKDPELSICVTVKDRSKVEHEGTELRLFPNLIASLAACLRPEDRAEIVVTDWHSQDTAMGEWLLHACAPTSVRLVEVDEPGFSRGRGLNIAAANATGRILLFLDADMLVSRELIDHVVGACRRDVAIFPICFGYDGPDHARGSWRDSGFGLCAVDADVWTATGGWPEWQSWGGEDDVFLRAVSERCRILREQVPGFFHQWHPPAHAHYLLPVRTDWGRFVDSVRDGATPRTKTQQDVVTCFIGEGYTPRLEPHYFVDDPHGAVWQPDVYPLAEQVAVALGRDAIIDLGCGRAGKLRQLHGRRPDWLCVGVDFRDNIAWCQEHHAETATWIDHDFESDRPLDLDPTQVARSVLVCADVIEHLINPWNLLKAINGLLRQGAGAIILSTPDRASTYPDSDHRGPPGNPAHVREWTMGEFARLLAYSGMALAHLGLTRSHDRSEERTTLLAIGLHQPAGSALPGWLDHQQQHGAPPFERAHMAAGARS